MPMARAIDWTNGDLRLLASITFVSTSHDNNPIALPFRAGCGVRIMKSMSKCDAFLSLYWRVKRGPRLVNMPAKLKHYHQNILGIFRDIPVGKSGISSWESEHCLSQAMIRNCGNGQNLLGICWEFWRNMQMRFTGTKCLIKHWEYFPVWIPGMLCKIPTRFSQCLIRRWEWWETAGNLLGNSTNYANEMFRYKMSDQRPGISPRLSQYQYLECYARFLPYLSISQCVWSDTVNTCPTQMLEL